MKKLLVIAYHFPPLVGSSGIQRTLSFVRDLPSYGWEPLVLTCVPSAYERIDSQSLADVPTNVVVSRAFAMDAARQLSVRRRYPSWIARPDRWVSWFPMAIVRGLRLIRRYGPDALFSTYPIATAHMIGAALAARSGLPWIADFRDPMAQDGYPADPATWRSFSRIEKAAFGKAAACTVTTPSAADLYRKRYPDSRSRIVVIENGYDEDSFAATDEAHQSTRVSDARPLTLLHSGVVYHVERNPSELFKALARLRRDGVDGQRLRVRFRAPVYVKMIRELAAREGVLDMIEVEEPLSYREALREMMEVDGLLLLQASNCNAQIPAKLYEYLRAGRPVVALTDVQGDTARVLRAAGISRSASLDDASEILALLREFISSRGHQFIASEDSIKKASRRHRAFELAGLLDQVRECR